MSNALWTMLCNLEKVFGILLCSVGCLLCRNIGRGLEKGGSYTLCLQLRSLPLHDLIILYV